MLKSETILGMSFVGTFGIKGQFTKQPLTQCRFSYAYSNIRLRLTSRKSLYISHFCIQADLIGMCIST